MGIEDDVGYMRVQIDLISAHLRYIEDILTKEQPKDRQDKEKAIKDTMPAEMG